MKRDLAVAFLFIGGAHHIYHAAPVAAEMVARAPGAKITILYADADQRAPIESVLALYGVHGVEMVKLEAPRWAHVLYRLFPRRSSSKLPLLLHHRRLLDSFDAIVVPERTSAWVRSLGVRHPKLIHFRHGAGDRAPKSEKRLGVFDLVVVPGAKDKRRAVDSGLVAPGRIAVVGYVKFDLLRRMRKRRAPLFPNRRPTILYNPHFDISLSSWERDADALIERFSAQDDYNLIVAPHIRLFEDATPGERLLWESRAEAGKIIVDLGSTRSIDMTYTMAADIYVGDVSSQVYEFIVDPRPCLYLDAHGVDWADNPKYACWRFGTVVQSVDALFPALATALADRQAHASEQRAALADAVGATFDGAAARGADAVLSYLERALPGPQIVQLLPHYRGTSAAMQTVEDRP